jgi:TatD DNase family protein
MPAVKKEQWKSDILVKGRNEPAAIVQVLEVMAGARNEDLYDLANSIYENTKKLFKFE